MNVIHVAGKVDPIADIEVIQTELCLADLSTVEKSLQRYVQGRQERRQGSGIALVKVLEKCQAVLDQAKPAARSTFRRRKSWPS